ncbi:hypothetical protein ACLQ3D_20955 [Micromonospora vinacea]|uniref:Uncharacterized protein n=1 Tax=Micromonospora vinacea TaxID=709878 RepID=A0ABS0JVF9_9ACTN|nr:hypothetical protein [Micromonospora vinacea]MBG6099807.1 hypothetical protein [Micromonospora vinacea]
MTPTRDYDDEPMTDDELQDAAMHIADQFSDHDRRFLALMSPQDRAGHERALWMLYHWNVDHSAHDPDHALAPSGKIQAVPAHTPQLTFVR